MNARGKRVSDRDGLNHLEEQTAGGNPNSAAANRLVVLDQPGPGVRQRFYRAVVR